MNSFLVTVAVKLLLMATGENPPDHMENHENTVHKTGVEIIDTVTNKPDSLNFQNSLVD